MQLVEPEVFLVSPGPLLDWSEIERYLTQVGGAAWLHRMQDEGRTNDDLGCSQPAETLVEFMARLCYRSWAAGLNPNVTRVRENSREYIHNILKSGHGRVLEHANLSYVFHNVSRVLTHELVRHSIGTTFAQESMRFVRLTDIPFWFPAWAKGDAELMRRATKIVEDAEEFQRWMAEHFKLDDPGVSFQEKKHKTSFMRRFAPHGTCTGVGATINARAARHIIYMRTALPAEEEIRLVMDDFAEKTLAAIPDIMQDYNPNENQEWVPEFLKV